MMQKCSELGNNPEAWQQLFRFGKNRLKVKKGPDGHYLEQECRDELQKTLPATTFESLMSSVATWMARLDEKDKKAQRQLKTAVKVPKKRVSEPPVEQTSEVGDNNELSAVVDLCSDGDEKDSLDAFDTETDDLGEVNLKEIANHVEGKSEVQTLKKKNVNTTQHSIAKFLGPRKSDALRRSLKTYARRRKSTEQTIGEALSEIMTTNKDPKILREVNRVASQEAAQKSMKSDCEGPKVNKEVAPKGDTTLVAAANSQPKLQIVTEPTAYYNLVAKPGAEDNLKQTELESKTEPEICTNSKENNPRKEFNPEQGNGDRTKDGALPEDSLSNQRLEQDNHAPQIRIRTDLGPHQRDVIRVRTDLLLEKPPAESVSSLENQSSSAETLVPERTANKRILPKAQSSQHPPKRPALESLYPQFSVAAPSSSCQVSISVTSASNPGYPTSITSSHRNPAPVGPAPVNPTPARPPVNHVPPPPVVTVNYKRIYPKTLAPISSTSTTSSNSYQGNVSNSCQPNLSNSVNSASGTSSGYPSGSHMRPVTIISSHQPNNSANCALITNGRHHSANLMPPPPAPSSNYSTVPSAPATAVRSAPSPIIPMMNNFPPINQYQPSMPMPAAPIRTLMYRTVAPAASIPPLSYATVPSVAPAPAIVMAGGASVLNTPIDLASIMGMLTQVEVFAFNQRNQEACNLVVKLRNSLKGGADVAYRR